MRVRSRDVVDRSDKKEKTVKSSEIEKNGNEEGKDQYEELKKMKKKK